VRVNIGIRIEELDGEAIVLDRSGAVVHRLSGLAVEALRLAREGVDDGDVPGHLEQAMASLVEAGVVSPSRLSRRRLMLAAGAGAGITTFVLASPAAAASVCPANVTPTADNNAGYFYISPVNVAELRYYRTGPGVTSIRVRLVGGGGGQGFNGYASGDPYGGGGGGGAFAEKVVAVTPCTTYAIRVGAGGVRANQNSSPASGAGTDGTATIFYADAVGTVEEFRAQPGHTGSATVGGLGGGVTVGSGITSYAGGNAATPTGSTVSAGGGGGAGGAYGAGGNGGAGGGLPGGVGGVGGGTTPFNGGSGGVGSAGENVIGNSYFVTEPERRGTAPGGGPSGGRPGSGANGHNGGVWISAP
jgi:hypothetical protein